MSCIVILELGGPILVQMALRIAGETPEKKKMSLMPFAPSRPLSIGVELELQLLSCNDYNLASSAPDVLRRVEKRAHPGEIKPEMTRSMIEINTSVQQEYTGLVEELRALRDVVSEAGRFLNVAVAGGGTHPFQQWHERRIYDKPRFRELSELYGYLSKQFTIFGQHVHIGCPDPDERFLCCTACRATSRISSRCRPRRRSCRGRTRGFARHG